ncbi:MAG: LEA type 2 family protein [Gemmatimonadales bacterium]
MRSLTWRLGWGLLVGGCTPLGLWLYEDPVVTVSQITLELGSGPARSPVTVDLAMQNTNDYPLSAERLELSLRLDGMAVGETQRDSTVPMAMDTVLTIALPISLGQKATPERLRKLGFGTHTFAVRGQAIFQTPIGKRKVPFAQEGSMIFGARSGSNPYAAASDPAGRGELSSG